MDPFVDWHRSPDDGDLTPCGHSGEEHRELAAEVERADAAAHRIEVLGDLLDGGGGA